MKKFLGLVSLMMLVATAPAMAIDGKALYEEKGCSGCHGEGGQSMGGGIPSLRGQYADYTAKQAALIRDGKRKSGSSDMMTGAIKDLGGVTDTELKAIAEYLSAQ